MDAGVRTSLFQIKRRACGGRPMTAAAARRRVFCARRGGGLGDVSSSTRVRSETLVQRCVLVTVPPHFFCVCPRSFNQALRLSTRWMFGRVNRMVVIGRFGAFFGRRLWRTLRRACGQAQRSPMRRVACSAHGVVCAAVGLLQSACEEALLRGVAAPRDTATVLQCSMRSQTTRSLIPAALSRCAAQLEQQGR
jgi:hypothetical protein